MKINWKIGCAVLVLLLLTSGCASAMSGRSDTAQLDNSMSKSNDYYTGESEYAAEESLEYSPSAAGDAVTTASSDSATVDAAQVSSTQDRKLVMTYDVSLQTLSFDDSVGEISALVSQYGGYVESSYIEGQNLYETRGNRAANFSVRVPVEDAVGLVNKLGEDYNVVSTNTYQEDITNSYYDVEARLNSLRTQEAKLLEMMELSEDPEYLLAVSEQHRQVIYEIEVYTSAMERMENSIRLSTVNIHVSEVVKYQERQEQPGNFGERMSSAWSGSWKGFVSFCQGFVVFLVWALPFLIILAVIAIVVIVLIRRSIKKSRNRRSPYAVTQSPPSQNPAQASPTSGGQQDSNDPQESAAPDKDQK